MIKTNKAYESGDMTKEEFVKTLKNIQMTLEESIQCLQPEADGTKEAHQGRLAAKAMAAIKELIFFSDFHNELLRSFQIMMRAHPKRTKTF